MESIEFEPTKDQRFERHRLLTEKYFPLKMEYGYFALHSFAFPAIEIPKEEFQKTFLDPAKKYSELLSCASSKDVHPKGYTRRYEINIGSPEQMTTYATTCYFDGHIVTEGYIDKYCEGEYRFNPCWFIYEIQRHLQLTKEVFEGYINTAFCMVIFQNIEKFQWEIYRYSGVYQKKPYVGYHENIILQVSLSEIHGRDKWNIKIEPAEKIMTEIARIFGMNELPQPYWNNKGELDYSRNDPER